MQQDELAFPDAYDVELIKCPWVYNAIFRKKAPVHYDDVNDLYLVNTYDLVCKVMLDQDLYSSEYMEKLIDIEFDVRTT